MLEKIASCHYKMLVDTHGYFAFNDTCIPLNVTNDKNHCSQERSLIGEANGCGQSLCRGLFNTYSAEFAQAGVNSNLLSDSLTYTTSSDFGIGGRIMRAIMRQSRENVAQCLGVKPHELVFTSGGTEANNLAIKGVFFGYLRQKMVGNNVAQRYLISGVEHLSVRKSMEFLTSLGCEVVELPISRTGEIDWQLYEELLVNPLKPVALVSVIMANPVSGLLMPIAKMAQIARKHGVLFHSDMVQALGKIPINLIGLDVDLASFSGHKCYAGAGAGVLYVRDGVRLVSLLHGESQENGRRAGQENIAAISQFGQVCARMPDILRRLADIRAIRADFEMKLVRQLGGVSVIGVNSRLRLPNTSCLLIAGIQGATLAMALDLDGIKIQGVVDKGTCGFGNNVLMQMGYTAAEADSSLTVSFGYQTEADDVELLIQKICKHVGRLRALSRDSLNELF